MVRITPSLWITNGSSAGLATLTRDDGIGHRISIAGSTFYETSFKSSGVATPPVTIYRSQSIALVCTPRLIINPRNGDPVQGMFALDDIIQEGWEKHKSEAGAGIETLNDMLYKVSDLDTCMSCVEGFLYTYLSGGFDAHGALSALYYNQLRDSYVFCLEKVANSLKPVAHTR